MRKDLRIALTNEFEREIRRRLPQFSRRSDIRVPSGDQVYSWTPGDGSLTFFLILELNRDWDSFNVALAWNAAGGDLPRYAAMTPKDQPTDGQLRFPLYGLWQESPVSNPWYWEVRPSPRLDDPASWIGEDPNAAGFADRARVLARDVVANVEEKGLPYFERVAQDLNAERVADS
jgi:hypothetical protein